MRSGNYNQLTTIQRLKEYFYVSLNEEDITNNLHNQSILPERMNPPERKFKFLLIYHFSYSLLGH